MTVCINAAKWWNLKLKARSSLSDVPRSVKPGSRGGEGGWQCTKGAYCHRAFEGKSHLTVKTGTPRLLLIMDAVELVVLSIYS